MLRVLYVAPDFPNTNRNAAQVRANQLLPRLAKSTDLFVFSYSDNDCLVKETENSHTLVTATFPRKAPGILPTFGKRPRSFFRYAYPEAIKKFIDIVISFKPDIIHFDSFATFGLYDYLNGLNLESKPKVVLHPHDAVSKLYDCRISAMRPMLKRYFLTSQKNKIRYTEATLYPKADLCLVDSPEDAEYLALLDRRTNIQTLSLGYDETVYNQYGNTIDLVRPNIVMSGAMGSAQNVEAAQRLCNEIMPQVWKIIPSMHVYLVGSSPSAEVLRLENDQRVHVTGYVEDLAAYLRSADIYACPLKLGSGMRTRTIEALACGCAMVTTPEGVVGIDVQGSLDSAPWILADSNDKFAQSIISLLDTPELLNDLRNKSTILANTYSWSETANKLLSMYSSITG